MKSLLIEEE